MIHGFICSNTTCIISLSQSVSSATRLYPERALPEYRIEACPSYDVNIFLLHGIVGHLLPVSDAGLALSFEFLPFVVSEAVRRDVCSTYLLRTVEAKVLTVALFFLSLRRASRTITRGGLLALRALLRGRAPSRPFLQGLVFILLIGYLFLGALASAATHSLRRWRRLSTRRASSGSSRRWSWRLFVILPLRIQLIVIVGAIHPKHGKVVFVHYGRLGKMADLSSARALMEFVRDLGLYDKQGEMVVGVVVESLRDVSLSYP